MSLNLWWVYQTLRLQRTSGSFICMKNWRLEFPVSCNHNSFSEKYRYPIMAYCSCRSTRLRTLWPLLFLKVWANWRYLLFKKSTSSRGSYPSTSRKKTELEVVSSEAWNNVQQSRTCFAHDFQRLTKPEPRSSTQIWSRIVARQASI